MTDPRERLSYFAPSPASPWKWTKDGRVVVWNDGTTVAFREELSAILRALAAGGGLPSFGAIVIMLGALKGKMPDAAWMVGPAVLEEVTTLEDVRELRRRMRVRIESALDDLADIATLSYQSIPALAEPSGKAALVEVLLEQEPAVVSPEDGRRLLGDLDDGALDGEGFVRPTWRAVSRVLQDVESLARGWKHFDPHAFELRLRTGLNELPGPAELDEVPPADRARMLLEELTSDRDFVALARLTRDLMAALYLPHRVLPRDEAPSGGFADISNRGSLDRLLMSELAHDDLTLAVRVALGEALYVKREPPAERPEGTFAILIDVGIRLWGVPRVFSTAVALALVALQSRDRDVAVYRSRAGRVEPIDILTRSGLTEHLEKLDTALHPGPSIRDFIAMGTDREGSEAVIVTHEDTIADPEFRSALRRDGEEPLYIATVGRHGQFRLMEYPALEGKVRSRAVLDLEQIIPSETSHKPILTPGHDAELPLILAVRPFPFYLPVRGKIDKIVNRIDGEGGCLTRDGRLLVWQGRHEGARELTKSLPSGQPLLLELGAQELIIVKVRGSSVRITTVDREDGGHATVVLERSRSAEFRGASYLANAVLLYANHAVEAVDPKTGRTLDRLELAHMTWAGGRFYVDDGWHVVTWTGIALHTDRVHTHGIPPESILRMFDREEFEGPLVVSRGSGVSTSTGELLVEGDVRDVAEVADDGSRLLATTGSQFLLFDVEKRRLGRWDTAPPASWLKAASDFVPTRNLRYRLMEVAVSSKGALALRTTRGQWLEVIVTEQGRLGLRGTDAPTGRGLAFREMTGASTQGFRLSEARWESGTRVFLDSRGLVHLKASDPDALEVSLVIGQWDVAAWSSDGKVCGSRFFLGSAPRVEAQEMLEKMARILEPAASGTERSLP